MKNRLFIPLILVVSSMTPPPTVASTYRWVDENGQVHYSDRLPPQEVNRAYSVINKGGVTVDSVEQAKTKEQLEEENRRQQQREEQDRIAHERATHDHILLDTYTKVSDLEDTRDRYISTLDGQIKVSEHKLENLNRNLERLSKSAARLEREGKPVPQEMNKDIATLKTQIEAENSFIRTQRAQQQEVKEKFAADILRYKELKGEQQNNNK